MQIGLCGDARRVMRSMRGKIRRLCEAMKAMRPETLRTNNIPKHVAPGATWSPPTGRQLLGWTREVSLCTETTSDSRHRLQCVAEGLASTAPADVVADLKQWGWGCSRKNAGRRTALCVKVFSCSAQKPPLNSLGANTTRGELAAEIVGIQENIGTCFIPSQYVPAEKCCGG
jgi:hypothetical protein